MNLEEWYEFSAPAWLAASVDASLSQVVVDVGSFQGNTCFFLAKRFPQARVYGIDWDLNHVRVASQNARNKGMGGQVEFFYSDGRSVPPRLAAGTLDQAVALFQPSYGEAPNVKSFSNQVLFALTIIKLKGFLTVLLPTILLPDLLKLVAHKVGNIHVHPLWFGKRNDSDFLIVSFTKGVNSNFALHEGFAVTDKNDNLTEIALKVNSGKMNLKVTG